jgi:hypothetical protein
MRSSSTDFCAFAFSFFVLPLDPKFDNTAKQNNDTVTRLALIREQFGLADTD